jgi:hypothetical protein
MGVRKRWAEHRLLTRLTAVRAALYEEKTPEIALTALIDTARWCEGRFEDPSTWLDLVLLATEIAVYLESSGEYHAFLEYFGETGLGDEDTPPRELIETLKKRHREISPDSLLGVGRWLRDVRPAWALGPYLMGHALSQPALGDSFGSADAFDQAARRARRASEDAWEVHCRLRQGSVLLTTSSNVAAGRAILGSLDWNRLGPLDRLWMAVALSSSPRWTDRVRALDILLDLHRAIRRARPDHRELRLQDLRHGAATVFKMAGLHLPEIEAQRLDEVSHTFFVGDEQRRWLGHLNARQQLSRVASLPMEQSEEVLPLLDKLAAIYPERWRPAAEAFRILATAWGGTHVASEAAPALRRRSRRLPVVERVAELLDLLAPDRQTSLTDLTSSLASLNATLQTLSHDDGAGTRPLALIWPRLLESTASPSQPELPELLVALARHHVQLSPPPACGWWTLSAHLFQGGWHGAAHVIAEAALHTQPEQQGQIPGFVARQMFQSAIDVRDTSRANRWIPLI